MEDDLRSDKKGHDDSFESADEGFGDVDRSSTPSDAGAETAVDVVVVARPRTAATLSRETQDFAARELNEDPEMRAAVLDEFRSWLSHHPAIRRCRSDDPFLLRFLRTTKFDAEKAKTRLVQYLQVRKKHVRWSRDLDIDEPKLRKFASKGFMFVLPERDDLGRRVIFSIADRTNPHEETTDDTARLFCLIIETLLEDEENQVRGVVHLSDAGGLRLAHITAWRPSDIKTILMEGEKSYPVRHKMLHIVNMPFWASYVIRLIRRCLSKKLQERFLVHSNGIEDVHLHVPKRILPKEYGGEVPVAEMTEMWMKELESSRKQILALDDIEIDTETSHHAGWGGNKNKCLSRNCSLPASTNAETQLVPRA